MCVCVCVQAAQNVAAEAIKKAIAAVVNRVVADNIDKAEVSSDACLLPCVKSELGYLRVGGYAHRNRGGPDEPLIFYHS